MTLAQPPAIEITYIGGPTTVFSIAGVTFITDPTFDAAGKVYTIGSVTLQKTAGPALQPKQLGKIDVALVSHDQHPDNLDTAGRALLSKIPLVLTTTIGAERLGGGAIGLVPWQTRIIKSPSGATLRVTATPARHGPVGIEKHTGDVVGFIISAAENNTDVVYVTGDTVWYEGTMEVARRFQPRVVLLFGGAASTRGPFHLTMDTNDAVEAATAFKSATVVPVHHEGWAHFTQSQQDLAKTFATLGLTDRLTLVEAGKTLSFTLEGNHSVSQAE
jgi:L-ascorbate metabolism protein UlaG (beta-lactamase superfamily)